MQTTLDIDDDVLAAARDLATAQGKTVGEIISELARRSLTAPTHGMAPLADEPVGFAGPVWHTLAHREGVVVTPELIQRVQEDIDREDATAWDHGTDRPRTF